MITKLPPKRPADFATALAEPEPDERPVVQELLYAGESTFLVADPAVGKSTLATQIALHLTAGTPCFDIFDVAEPCNVYYIALETRWRRQISTIRKMRTVIQPDLNRLRWDAPTGMDLNTPNGADMSDLVKRIMVEWQKPGVVILDPLYLTCSQDLRTGEAGRAVSNFLNTLMNATGCATLVLHHTHREKYSAQQGKRIEEEDPIYGSRWLKAHAALSWYVTSTSQGTYWKLKKDRFKKSRHGFNLAFDPATQCSSGAVSSRPSVNARLQQILAQQTPGTLLTYADLARQSGNALNYVKLVMTDPVFDRFAERINPGDGKAVLWKVRAKADQPEPEPEFA